MVAVSVTFPLFSQRSLAAAFKDKNKPSQTKQSQPRPPDNPAGFEADHGVYQTRGVAPSSLSPPPAVLSRGRRRSASLGLGTGRRRSASLCLGRGGGRSGTAAHFRRAAARDRSAESAAFSAAATLHQSAAFGRWPQRPDGVALCVQCAPFCLQEQTDGGGGASGGGAVC